MVRASGFISGGPVQSINLGDMAQQLRAITILKSRFPDHHIITSTNSLGDKKLPTSDGVDASLTNYIGKVPNGILGSMILVMKIALLIINSVIFRILGFSLHGKQGRQVLQNLNASRFLFFAGSGTLNEIYLRGVSGLWLLTIFIARILGKPIVLIGQQIGPLEGRFTKHLFSRILSSTDFLGCRDQESVALLRSIGVVDTKVRYSGDEGGYLPPAKYANGHSLLNARGVRPGYVAVHIRIDGNCPFEPWLDRYAEILDKIARALDRQVLLVPMAYRGNHDDRVVLDRLASKMGSASVLLQCESPELTKSCLAHASLAIGVANHFVIFAASVGVPCVGLHASEYMRQKLEGASERFPHVRSYAIDRIQNKDFIPEVLQLAKEISNCEIPEPFDPELPEDYWDWLKVLESAGVDAPPRGRTTHK